MTQAPSQNRSLRTISETSLLSANGRPLNIHQRQTFIVCILMFGLPKLILRQFYEKRFSDSLRSFAVVSWSTSRTLSTLDVQTEQYDFIASCNTVCVSFVRSSNILLSANFKSNMFTTSQVYSITGVVCVLVYFLFHAPPVSAELRRLAPTTQVSGRFDIMIESDRIHDLQYFYII